MFPVALLALLIGTTLGVVWHQHTACSPDNCPICHLSHQAIEPAPSNARIAILIPTGSAPELPHRCLVLRAAPRQIPTRAPPA